MIIKKILVTGGAGFIGSHVAEYLHKQGHFVTILDDLSGGFVENIPIGVRFVKGSINDERLVDELVKGSDIVYHLAAYAAEGLSHNIRKFNYENNLIGSINLINSAIRHKIEHFVYTSSIAVYGSGNPPFNEKQYPMPEDPYGISKLAVELDLMAAKETHGLNSTIFRPHNVYGERQNIGDSYRNVVGIFMNRILLGLPPIIFGDGKQTRAFTYIGDITPCIAEAPFIPKANLEVINIGSEKEYSLNELVEIVLKEMNSNFKPQYEEQRHEVKHAYCVNAKAKRLLGFEEKVSLEEGIKNMAKWVLQKGSMKPTFWDSYEIEEGLPTYWKNMKEEYEKIKRKKSK